VGVAEDVDELTVLLFDVLLLFVEAVLLFDELFELVEVTDLEVDVEDFDVESLLEVVTDLEVDVEDFDVEGLLEVVTDLEVDVVEVLRVDTDLLLLEDWLPVVPFLIYTLRRFPAPQYSY